MGKLTEELKTISPLDIDEAYYHIDMAKRKVTYLRADSDNIITRILGIVGDILIFVRSEFWEDDGTLTVPKAINIFAWIRIIIFFVRKVKAIVQLVKK